MITRHTFKMEVVVDGEFECDVAQAIKTSLEGQTIASTVRESELLTVIIDEVSLEEMRPPPAGCTHEDQYVNDRSQFVCRDCGEELGR